MKKPWGKIKPGEIVTLGGRDWTVEKSKPKGKRLKVRVRSSANVAESLVDPSEKVKIAEAAPTRAARPTKPKGPPPTKPPKPAAGDPWETQQDRIERNLSKILQATLVGEATDEDAGYYVPHVDVTTVASHLAIFHGGIPDGAADEAAMMGAHAREHMQAEAGNIELFRNHWHTDKRPTTGKKKGKK